MHPVDGLVDGLGQVDQSTCAVSRSAPWSPRASSSRSSTSLDIRVPSHSMRRRLSGSSRGGRAACGLLHPGQLGVAADGGERGAQLVGGVGEELPHPLLAGQPGRELGLDGGEQGVHRVGQLPDLGVGVVHRHAPVQPGALGRQLGGDLAGGAR